MSAGRRSGGISGIAAALVALTASAASARADRVEEARFVTVGGIEQWVTIRGADRTNPILLVLHGGPAEVQSPLAPEYAPFERDFVVVQWDQRGPRQLGFTGLPTRACRPETSRTLSADA